MMLQTQNQSGISLIEIVLVIAAVGFLALLIGTIPSTINAINRSSHISLAKDIAGKQVESLRKSTYANLSNGQSTFTDPDLVKLNNYAANYEVVDCPTSICTHDEKAKQVTITVSWNEGAKTSSTRLVTIIGEGGVGQ